MTNSEQLLLSCIGKTIISGGFLSDSSTPDICDCIRFELDDGSIVQVVNDEDGTGLILQEAIGD